VVLWLSRPLSLRGLGRPKQNHITFMQPGFDLDELVVKFADLDFAPLRI
jgi:hypothetical protein